MKAAVVHSFDSPLEIEDVPIPEPGAEQVLVRIEACGLCHTDIHAARGEWPIKPSLPFIPGHEGVGIVERARCRATATASPWACASRCRGSATHAATAATATPAGRRSASPSRTWATRSTAASPSTRSATPATSSRVPDGIDPARRRAADVRRRDHLQGGQDLRRDVLAISSPSSARAASATSRSSTRAITGAAVVAVDINAERLESARALGAEHIVHAGEEDPSPRSSASAAPTAAISTAVSPPRSSRPSARSRAAARSSASACRPTTRCSCRSSRRSSAASRSAARSSARTPTSRRCSSCTAAG